LGYLEPFQLTNDHKGGGSRTTPETRAIQAEWLQKQGPIGTQMPAARAGPVKKDEPARVKKDEPKAEKQ
jgi:hypothetical protein